MINYGTQVFLSSLASLQGYNTPGNKLRVYHNPGNLSFDYAIANNLQPARDNNGLAVFKNLDLGMRAFIFWIKQHNPNSAFNVGDIVAAYMGFRVKDENYFKCLKYVCEVGNVRCDTKVSLIVDREEVYK
jgi:hypothetical protein